MKTIHIIEKFISGVIGTYFLYIGIDILVIALDGSLTKLVEFSAVMYVILGLLINYLAFRSKGNAVIRWALILIAFLFLGYMFSNLSHMTVK